MKRGERFECYRGKQKIVGECYMPVGEGPFPLLIFSHGYGYNWVPLHLARMAEHGIAAVSFDFCGGSPFSRSSGKSTDMSVLTEAEDLSTVIDFVTADARIDKARIFLSGQSQGGYVSTIVGVRRMAEIRQLFLLCPAYVIVDMVAQHRGQLPFRFANMLLGQNYLDGVNAFPIYERMREYTRSVTIYHGTADGLVPMRYAERAAQTFPQAELQVFQDAGHSLRTCIQEIEDDIIAKILATK